MAQLGDWIESYSNKRRRKYWTNVNTQQSLWSNPTADDVSMGRYKKCLSTTHQVEYLYDIQTGQTMWEIPTDSTAKAAVENDNTVVDDIDSNDVYKLLDYESSLIAVNIPECPRILQSINIHKLVDKLKNEVPIDATDAAYKHVFILRDDECALISRAIQEDEILKTKLKLRVSKDSVIDLPSFWEVWSNPNHSFSREILSSPDPNEMKWTLQKKYNYKLATTFQPGYAKAIYSFFHAETVLDPCAGWGCRLIGAAAANKPAVRRYVAFDPNRNLRPGYAKLMKLFGHSVANIHDNLLQFSNGFEVRSLPFEKGALELADNSFDLVFTSPPFFDYEMYNPDNPDYKDWIKDFYEPLMQQACRCVKPGHYVCIHIGDTSAGAIVPFLKEKVHLICDLKLVFNLGLKGVMSNKTRDVWVFQKGIAPVSNPLSSSSAAMRITHSEENIRKINSITNPRIQVIPITEGVNTYRLIDDGVCIGGTKQRLLGRIVREIPAAELIYAGPDGGIAQVALAYTALLWGKKATIFLNTKVDAEKPPLVQLAEALGATVHLSDSTTGRTLEMTQNEALKYQQCDPDNRMMLPFGLKSKKGEKYFDLFFAALSDAIPRDLLLQPPSRLWLVGGSAFLFDVLTYIWPDTEFHLVQVGKTIWPDQLEGKRVQLYVAPEKFGQLAKSQPPYKTVPWYDAKVWQFVQRHGKNGDYIWNVGCVPDNPLVLALKIKDRLKEIFKN